MSNMSNNQFRSQANLHWVFLALFLLFIEIPSGNALTLAQPPSKDDLVGAWSGYSESDLEFLRLELDADDTGYLAISYLPDVPVSLYKISKWALTKSKLRLVVSPVGPDAEAIVIKKIDLGYTSMQINFGDAAQSKKIGWQRVAKLHKDDQRNARSQSAQQKIGEARRPR